MKVIKRDGRLEEFTPDKIYKAVKAAYTQVYVEDHDKIEKVVKKSILRYCRYGRRANSNYRNPSIR